MATLDILTTDEALHAASGVDGAVIPEGLARMNTAVPSVR